MSCFTPGIRIATPKGERPVETLRVGDPVITRDNGIQEIVWVGRQTLTERQLSALPHLRPILIRKGVLEAGVPERDMRLSPNHRLLVSSDRAVVHFEEHFALIPVKHLVDHQGIVPARKGGIAYLSVLFETNQVILANGVWAEAFQPTLRALNGMGNAQRNEMFEVFPILRNGQPKNVVLFAPILPVSEDLSR